MILNTTKGIYKLEINYRDAFNLEAFQEKYLEECYDKYQYIVGDISSNILRLKGFDDTKEPNGRFKLIDKYIEDSCAFGCPYFVLSRIHSEKEMNNADNEAPITTDDRFDITPIKKENFDKESLILKTSTKTKPNIVIDSQKLNQIPGGSLPEDLVELAQAEKNNAQNQRRNNNKEQREPEPEQTFVSSSPDFDPSKKEKNKKRNNNNNRKNNNRRG